MRRDSIRIVMAAGLLASCLGSQPKIQTGPNAVATADGLHFVDNVLVGNMYMKPDYQVGTYDGFILGRTRISFAEGSRQLDKDEQNKLIGIFEEIARETIARGGTKEADAIAPCVAQVNLRLEKMSFSGATGVASIGAVTLVLQIRDSYTGEPLLIYGQRRKLGTGALSPAFKRFASRFQRDFNNSLPPPDHGMNTMTCQDRAVAGEEELSSLEDEDDYED